MQIEDSKKINIREGNESLHLSILMAEDDPSIREALEVLFSLDHEVKVVTNGQELFEELKANPNKYNFIISDNDMPKMTGLEAIREIREWEQIEKRKPLPIILMSGKFVQEFATLKFVNVTKPLSLEEEIIKEAIKKVT